MAFLFSNLYFFLMLGYILYIICRFSKSPSSIDDNKKKEVDVYKIDKIYMISSICFVICAFFIINPLLTFHLYQYIRYLCIFFGIFNALMTVLYIKYRDDIYFYESYNLIFTLLITFGAMSSDYKDAAYFMYERFTRRDAEERGNFSANENVTFIRTPMRIAGLDYDPHETPPPRELAVRGYTGTDHVETDAGRNVIADPLDRLTLDRLRRGKHDLNPQETQEQLNAQNETLREKFDEFNPQLTRRNKFKSSRKDRIHPDTTAYNKTQNPVASKATVPSQVFDETGEMMSRHEQYKTPQISTFTSLHPKRGLSPQETDTFSSHDQEFVQKQFDHFRN